MSCISLPKCICDKIDSKCIDFFWGSSGDSKKIHLANRDKLFRPIEEGGLGIRPAFTVNKALVAKQIWRVVTSSPLSLKTNTLKSKYVNLSSNPILLTSYNSSWLWKGIVNHADVVLDNIKWTIGNGLLIPLSHPLWGPMQPGSETRGRNLLVANLLMHNQSGELFPLWNSEFVFSFYAPNVAQQIISTPISFLNTSDRIVWTGNASGNYQIRDGFSKSLIHSQAGLHNPFWKFLWAISLPGKFLLFMWKILNNAISSVDVLSYHHLVVHGKCQFGCDKEESLFHILCSCPFTRALWFAGSGIRVDHADFNDFKYWLQRFLLQLKEDDEVDTTHRIIILINSLWLRRNRVLHEGMKLDTNKATKEVQSKTNFCQITFDAELQVAKGDHVIHSSSTPRISHDGWTVIFHKFKFSS